MIDSALSRLWDRFGDAVIEGYLGHPVVVVTVFVVLGNALLLLLLWGFLISGATANLIENGSFERHLPGGWGTGWVEDQPGLRDQARLHGYVLHSTAQARWSTDSSTHRSTGDFSLRIIHTSAKADHVWSSVSQRIRVREGTTYELRFWVKAGRILSDGDLWVSPNGSSIYWDDPKVSVPAGTYDGKERVLRFNSGDRRDLDIRIVAVAPLDAWIDDVSVQRVPRWRN